MSPIGDLYTFKGYDLRILLVLSNEWSIDIHDNKKKKHSLIPY